MEQAAEHVVSRQLSLCEAASTFGVPKTTLFLYMRKLKKQEAFEKCLAHSPLRAASRQFTRCR